MNFDDKKQVANLLGAVAAIYSLPTILQTTKSSRTVAECRRYALNFGKEVAKDFLDQNFTDQPQHLVPKGDHQ